jgi:hypothetical protein
MPDHIMDGNQLMEIINRAIDSLPERCREFISLVKKRAFLIR